jgi:hypothetical protein
MGVDGMDFNNGIPGLVESSSEIRVDSNAPELLSGRETGVDARRGHSSIPCRESRSSKRAGGVDPERESDIL